MFDVGVVAGRFRLLHVAHKELIIKAYAMCKELHIIINDDESVNRIGTVNDTRVAISRIIQNIDGDGKSPKVIIHVTENLEGISWDEKVLELVPNIDVIFNSKEDYDNILIKNHFISLNSSSEISATMIESDFISNRHLIADELKSFINKRVVITGIESCGKTSLVKKLASYFNTSSSNEFGRYYSEINLGMSEESMKSNDFPLIAMEQILQNERVNKESNGIMIQDSDTVVTKYYMDLYSDEMGYIVDDLDSQHLDFLIKRYMKNVDLVIYLEPNVPFVSDGLRFLEDNNKRIIKNNELKDLYGKYGIELVVLDNNSYVETFDSSVKLIGERFKKL